MKIGREQAINEIVEAQSRGMYDMENKDYANMLRDGVRGVADLDNRELAIEYHSTLIECDDPNHEVIVEIEGITPMNKGEEMLTRTLSRSDWGKIFDYLQVGRDACDGEGGEDDEEIGDIDSLKRRIIG